MSNSLFPTVFSTHLENILPFTSRLKLKLSSAISLSLEESKICHLGKYNTCKIILQFKLVITNSCADNCCIPLCHFINIETCFLVGNCLYTVQIISVILQHCIAPIHVFQFLLLVLCTMLFPSHWQLCGILIVGTMISIWRRMNPVTITHQSIRLGI